MKNEIQKVEAISAFGHVPYDMSLIIPPHDFTKRRFFAFAFSPILHLFIRE